MSATFSCQSCGAKYQQGSLTAGQRVKCRKCDAVITIPEAQASPQERTTRPARSKTSSRRSRRPAPPPKKSAAPIILGVVAVAVIGAAIFFLTRGSDKNDALAAAKSDSTATKDGSATEDSGAKAAPAKKTSREEFEEHLAAAKDGDQSARIGHLVAAAHLLDQHGWPDVSPTRESIYEQILTLDSNHKEARKELGYLRYTGDYAKYKGQWLKSDKFAEVTNEAKKLAAAAKKAAAEKAERERWTKDKFSKKARSVADYFIEDLKPLEGFKLKFFFDMPEIPRPYLLMVEDVATPDPLESAKMLGPGLAALRQQFLADNKKVIAGWDNEDFIVPVLIFRSAKSYENYRDHNHPYFPGTATVGAFYVPSASVPGASRGTLYVWQGGNEKSFYHTVFHEATHQIMHNAARMSQMPPTPWLEEGIAEFWGSYKGNRHAGFSYRQFLKDRWPIIQAHAQAYMAWKGRGKTGPRNFIPPKEFLNVGREEFVKAQRALEDGSNASGEEKAKAGRTVNAVYALGWAWIFWSHYGPGKKSNGEQGKNIAAFHKTLGFELRQRYSLDRLAKAYGIESDEDWDRITDDFFFFIFRPMRKWANGMELPPLPQVQK